MVVTKVKVIYGAPASGKTTYAKKQLGDNDLIYDFDDIMQVITGLEYQQANVNVVPYVNDIRDTIIERVRNEDSLDNVYIITTFISKHIRESLPGADYIQMNTNKATCLHRIENSNRKNKHELNKVINDWYDEYGSGTVNSKPKKKCNYDTCRVFIDYDQIHCDKHKGSYEKNYDSGREKKYKYFYSSKAWRKARHQAMLRDEWTCQHCIAEGIYKHADVVHHIVEVREDWSRRLDIENLMCVCHGCHNAIHTK